MISMIYKIINTVIVSRRNTSTVLGETPPSKSLLSQRGFRHRNQLLSNISATIIIAPHLDEF